MKVIITHGKAAWPEGKGIGDVVELDGDTLPSWAVNKCTPVPDEAPKDEAKAEAKPKK